MTNCRGNPTSWEVPRQHNPAYSPTAIAFFRLNGININNDSHENFAVRLFCGIVILEKLSKFAKRRLSLHLFEDA